MRSVTVLAPAKLNLTLDVTGTRPDGYHTLDMIMQAVSLRERVTLRRSRGLSLSLPGSRVPANEHNTAYKAALAFFHGTGLLAGAAITVENSAVVAKCFEVIAKLAAQEGLTGGYRVISNVGEDAGQTVKHLHFHVLGGEKLPV